MSKVNPELEFNSVVDGESAEEFVERVGAYQLLHKFCGCPKSEILSKMFKPKIIERDFIEPFAKDNYDQCDRCQEWFDSPLDLDDDDICAECAKIIEKIKQEAL
jgi:formylmethanofuran dehydrogenase subunit E